MHGKHFLFAINKHWHKESAAVRAGPSDNRSKNSLYNLYLRFSNFTRCALVLGLRELASWLHAIACFRHYQCSSLKKKWHNDLHDCLRAGLLFRQLASQFTRLQMEYMLCFLSMSYVHFNCTLCLIDVTMTVYYTFRYAICESLRKCKFDKTRWNLVRIQVA